MKVLIRPAGIYGANCYTVFSEDTKKGIIIDPGGDVDEIIDDLNKNNISIQYIVLTHGHGDHIGGVKELKDKLNAPVVIHKEDSDMLQDTNLNLTNIMSMGTIEMIPDKTVEDGDILEFGDLKGYIIHTPGHTKGGICILVENSLFSGDTIFKGSIGRSDFYGGDYGTLIRSIKDKILTLSKDTIIYPGHGQSSTVEAESRSNPYLR